MTSGGGHVLPTSNYTNYRSSGTAAGRRLPSTTSGTTRESETSNYPAFFSPRLQGQRGNRVTCRSLAAQLTPKTPSILNAMSGTERRTARFCRRCPSNSGIRDRCGIYFIQPNKPYEPHAASSITACLLHPNRTHRRMDGPGRNRQAVCGEQWGGLVDGQLGGGGTVVCTTHVQHSRASGQENAANHDKTTRLTRHRHKACFA